ncbi:hypothetical protein [Streptomyces ipomoeae]|uniref:hypothetical protein n=1 Tax=Streptomyces ipomoeae TaxID=103232 RepID=UPI0029AE9FDB|nr:hypothetical protein [Streptomyces ipomoeae]MDX2697591.1 hypothetical protein [Streptomyces ipomoeae]MDX2845987.1 hypothetical protein [Streptomyces ipomoeae]
MGLFSRKADELFQQNEQAHNAAHEAARNGQPATAAAYEALSDAALKEWMKQTEEDHNRDTRRS